MQSHERVSTTGTAAGEGGGRKSSKPVMEKRRRARINASLAELKSLLLEAIRKEGTRHNKMEKADILEMAVQHLRQIQRQQFTGEPGSGESSVSSRYQLGYQACAQEVSKYLDSNSDEEIELKTKLLNHLANCITSDAFPSQTSTPVGSEFSTALPPRAGLSLLNTSAPSVRLDQRDTLSSSAAVIPTSLLPVTLTPTSSVAGPNASSLPHHLMSSSTSLALSSEITGTGAPPLFIPIPISPLSIGTLSPASVASGILTPEKQGPPNDFQTVRNSQVNHISVANSLDLSAVKISDTGCYKALALSQAAMNLAGHGNHSVLGGLAFQPNANLSVATANPGTNLETNNNNLVMPVVGTDNANLADKPLGSLKVSSLGQPIPSDVDQNSARHVRETNNNNSVIDETADNVNNNEGPLALPSFVNTNKSSQPTLHLNQANIAQLLHHQKQQQQLQKQQQQQGHQQLLMQQQNNNIRCQGHQQKDHQQPQVVLSSNDGALNANTSIIANMNQLQLIPTKTASGEIAFVLSTGLLNPTPLAIHPGPQANFAIPLHLPATGTLNHLSPTQPPQQEKTSQDHPNNQQSHDVKELLKLPLQESNAATVKAKHQSMGESSHASQAPSVISTPQNQSVQLAPLNLSSPNHNVSFQPQIPESRAVQSHPECQFSVKMSTEGSPRHNISTPSIYQSALQFRTRTSSLEAPKSYPNPHHRHPGYHHEQNISFRTTQSAEASASRFTEPAVSSHGPRRPLDFERTSPARSYHPSSVASFQSRVVEGETANVAAGLGAYDSSRGHIPQRFSHSPPLAHSTDGRRRSCSDAGHPLRHDRNRALFRPW